MLRSLAILPSDYGALCLIFVTLAWPTVFLGLYVLMFLGSALLLAAAVLRWSATLRSIDRSHTS